ncbi:MAG TPA: 2,3-diphosphoglycerate-dependent phosphoglycerate mutase [Patescibacteria group bacterium]|nr:2,3-diphosphoglycerate-dependent phosphoglycerate mutase [Patescibacteria group bacterium]
MSQPALHHVVFIRHGQSDWNLTNRFTGWTDVPLSDQGREEARRAGVLLRDAGYQFDLAFTSVLQRAIHTLHLVLAEMDQLWIPETKSWKLNERHYGALQGLNKAETAIRYGDEQVKIWRRSYATQPPPLTAADPRCPLHDPRYAAVPPERIPLAESLRDTEIRAVEYWHEAVAPAIRQGQRIVIAAHGNSLRALAKFLGNISPDDIMEFEIPTGVPLIYELDQSLSYVRHFYLPETPA